MSKCVGCGVELQNEDPKQIGYTPKLDGEYCQRCFRLRNYDDVTLLVKQGETDSRIYEEIRKMACLVCLVADLFDFEGSMIPGLQRHIGNKDVLLIGTKRDLLPLTLSGNKLYNWIRSKLKEENLYVKGICVSAYKGKDGVDEICDAITTLANGRPVVFMGVANAGKSTLINAILRKESITTSRYPGTTIDMMKLDTEIGTIYDTPGVMRKDNVVHYVDANDLKKIIPSKTLKPRNYQLYEPQSLAIGGVARLDFPDGKDVTVTCYFNDAIDIHRGKHEKSDELWSRHYGELLKPICNTAESFTDFRRYDFSLAENEKCDVMIHGFGWVCINTTKKQRLTVYLPASIGVSKGISRV